MLITRVEALIHASSSGTRGMTWLSSRYGASVIEFADEFTAVKRSDMTMTSMAERSSSRPGSALQRSAARFWPQNSHALVRGLGTFDFAEPCAISLKGLDDTSNLYSVLG